MRLHTEALHVEKSEQLVEREFSIKASAEAFSILSSGLYSDKILAIVRELSCNAWDAHVVAKNTNTPFEIKLPTSFDATFYVKDFGTGLSDFDVRGGWYNKDTDEKVSLLDAPTRWINPKEQAPLEGFKDVGGLYNTYFDSTKNKRDDLIGALGLGSKTPFSYAATFTVESRVKDVRRLYTAYVNDKGVPAVTLVGEEKSTEPNGLTISFAAKQGDTSKFYTAARKALMYFDLKPNVKGGSNFAPYTVKHDIKGTNWGVRTTDYDAHMNGAYVMQGFVAYPIDRNILSQNGLSTLGYKILELNVDFFVPLGQVNPAPSREALSYTSATIKNLCKAVDVAAAEMRDSIQRSFDACKTVWEARMLFVNFDEHSNKMHDIFHELQSSRPFTYKGVKLEESVTLDLTKISSTQILMSHLSSYRKKATTGGRWDPTYSTKQYDLTIHPHTTVLVDDVYNSTGIMTQYMTDLRSAGSSEGKYTIVLKGTTKSSYAQKEIDDILKQLGDPTFQLVSSLPYKKAKSTSTYRARKSDEVVVWHGYPENGGYKRNQVRRVFSRLCWIGLKVDPSDTKTERFYVPIERFTIVEEHATATSPSKEIGGFDTYLNMMMEIGILPTNVDIIGLNEKQAFRAKRNKAWHHLFSYCKEKFAEMNKTGVLTDTIVAHRVMDSIGHGIARHIVLDWKNICQEIVDGEFKNTIEKIFDVYTSAKRTKLSVQVIESVATRTGNDFMTDVDTAATKLTDQFIKTINKHAMLCLVDWNKVGSKDVSMLIDYINFIAKI